MGLGYDRLTPLLDEKSLNPKQFEMVVARVMAVTEQVQWDSRIILWKPAFSYPLEARPLSLSSGSLPCLWKPALSYPLKACPLAL